MFVAKKKNACQLMKKSFCVLSSNQCTISDTFKFMNEVHKLVINNRDILVSYDVSSQFINVPLEETIQLLPDKAFSNNNYWFNEMYHLNLGLLRVATKDHLFPFDGQAYGQTNGVAIGSSLGPLLANIFMSSIEETLECEGKIPAYYKRLVDDTLIIMLNKASTDNFLDILNQCHFSPWRWRVIACFLFLGIQLLNKHTHAETKAYIKPTNTGHLPTTLQEPCRCPIQTSVIKNYA